LVLLERGAECTLTLATQAELLSLNRTGLYYQPVPPSAEEVALKHRIDEIYTEHPFYGSRKIVVVLRPAFNVNRKAVQRHMREMGIAGIVPGPNLSKRSVQHKICNTAKLTLTERDDTVVLCKTRRVLSVNSEVPRALKSDFCSIAIIP
jgi:hypothetical protein